MSALTAASPNAVAEAKRLVHDMTDQPLTDALVDDTVARIADIRASDQGKRRREVLPRKTQAVMADLTPHSTDRRTAHLTRTGAGDCRRQPK